MMEEKREKSTRKLRGEAAIVKLLQEQVESGQSIKLFCAAHGIAEGTIHNWKQKYGTGSIPAPRGFSTLPVVPEPGLFATVGCIQIYQPVSVDYLKELLS